MAGFDDTIVRQYFELNGFFVRELGKSSDPGKKTASPGPALEVMRPDASGDDSSGEIGFQVFSADLARIGRGFVAVEGWEGSRFTPAMLKSSAKVFRFLEKEVLGKSGGPFANPAENAGAEAEEVRRLLVLPGLPASDPHRSESIELLRGRGVDAVITFSTILEGLVRQVDVNRSYAKSDMLQLLRVLKLYDMIRDPQMQLFGKE